MGFLSNKWNRYLKPQFLFTADKPTDLNKYVGRRVRLASGQSVDIETIVGNRFKPQFYEINGKHLIGMLRFHAQMTGATDITEKQFREFEEMEHSVEKSKRPFDA